MSDGINYDELAEAMARREAGIQQAAQEAKDRRAGLHKGLGACFGPLVSQLNIEVQPDGMAATFRWGAADFKIRSSGKSGFVLSNTRLPGREWSAADEMQLLNGLTALQPEQPAVAQSKPAPPQPKPAEPPKVLGRWQSKNDVEW